MSVCVVCVLGVRLGGESGGDLHLYARGRGIVCVSGG